MSREHRKAERRRLALRNMSDRDRGAWVVRRTKNYKRSMHDWRHTSMKTYDGLAYRRSRFGVAFDYCLMYLYAETPPFLWGLKYHHSPASSGLERG